MRSSLFTRTLGVVLFVAGATACDKNAGAPLSPSVSIDEARGTVTTVRGGLTSTPGTIDGVRVCRHGELPGLTEAQIEAIRALWAKFYDEVGDDLRLIAAVEKAAREAEAAGARPAEIAAILARADEAKANVAAAEKRLRDGIDAILNSDQRRRHCVAPQPLP